MYFFTSPLMLKFRGTRPCRTQQTPRYTFPTTFVYDQLRNYMPSSLQLPLSTLAPMQLAVLISSTRYKSTSISLFPVHPITGTSLTIWPTCISNYFSLLVTSSVPPLCYWTSGTVQHSRPLQHCLPHLLLSTQNGSPQYRARGFSFARISTQTAQILLNLAGSTIHLAPTHLLQPTSSTSNPHSPLTPPTPHYPCSHRPSPWGRRHVSTSTLACCLRPTLTPLAPSQSSVTLIHTGAVGEQFNTTIIFVPILVLSLS